MPSYTITWTGVFPYDSVFILRWGIEDTGWMIMNPTTHQNLGTATSLLNLTTAQVMAHPGRVLLSPPGPHSFVDTLGPVDGAIYYQIVQSSDGMLPLPDAELNVIKPPSTTPNTDEVACITEPMISYPVLDKLVLTNAGGVTPVFTLEMVEPGEYPFKSYSAAQSVPYAAFSSGLIEIKGRGITIADKFRVNDLKENTIRWA